ncbi:MAG: hypothetical protein AAF597_04265, partial [Bacteroidota bacterium]
MKHLILLCSLSFLCTCVRAQIDAPFAPFRPMVSYNYTNPFHEPAQPDPNVSPVLGFMWTGNEDLSFYRIPTVLAKVEDQLKLIPHFAAHETSAVSETTWELTVAEDNPYQMVINFGAAVNSEWESGPFIGKVDSIVVESFLGMQDSVKYISFADSETGEKFPSLRLSKEYGMIGGPYLNDPRKTMKSIQLMGFSQNTNWGSAGIDAGEDFLEPFELALSAFGARYYQEKREADVYDGISGTRVTRRTWRAGDPGCDPVLDASVNPYSVRQISYFLPANGSEPLDTVVNPSYQDWLGMSFVPYGPEDWQAFPLGSVVEEESGVLRAVLPRKDECLGPGVQLGNPLAVDPETGEVHQTDGEQGQVFYQKSMLPAHTPGQSEDWRLVGVESGNGEVCGLTWSFDELYTSLTAFPDDERITIAPNPAIDQTMLSVPFDLGSAWLEVYDGTGRMVRKTVATGG